MRASPDISGITRRQLLAGVAGVATAACLPACSRGDSPRFSGGMLGPNAPEGHRVRNRDFPSPTDNLRVDVAILGGGIAGLSAGAQLKRRGLSSFRILEMEKRPGGNSVSGANDVSRFPWGAHYVPIPSAESTEVIQLFEELGVITRYDGDKPLYREEYLCAEPTERLFIHGRWHEGLVPQLGLSARDRNQLGDFHARMLQWKSRRGSDGRRAFTIPVDRSSREPEFLKLDLITMASYLDENGWDSAPLRWYVDYCCRDDYGARSDQVSAWAGVHYFAARNAVAANAPDHAVLTWPEGNGWLAEQLRRRVQDAVWSGCVASNLENTAEGVEVDCYLVEERRSVRLHARAAICCTPRFVARHVLAKAEKFPDSFPSLIYRPWMVANLTLDRLPGGPGADLAWDNVSYHGASLGYVVATHQALHPFPRRTVLTYYQPLCDEDADLARKRAMQRSYREWCQSILAELRILHPDIEAHLKHLDVWIWGHGMVCPAPGIIWGHARRAMLQPVGNVFFAHSDMSGISIFEEAYTRGVQTADQVVNSLA